MLFHSLVYALLCVGLNTDVEVPLSALQIAGCQMINFRRFAIGLIVSRNSQCQAIFVAPPLEALHMAPSS